MNTLIANLNFNAKEIKNQSFVLENSNSFKLFIKREDEIHPVISGNKYRKLKFNIKTARKEDKTTLLTFVSICCPANKFKMHTTSFGIF